MTPFISRTFTLVALTALLAACGGGDSGERQAVAKVNKEHITAGQIALVLSRQQGLKPEQVDAASRQVLERLIDQELAVQQAEEQKLDRDTRVLQQIEVAKREILARAYVEKLGETAAKPSADEVSKYYNDNPALFAERRIYNLQEISIEAKPEQFAVLRAKLEAAKHLNEFLEYLKANDFKFVGNQAVRAAEQLPLPALPTLAKLKDGQSLLTLAPNGVQVLMLAGSRDQPVDLERAKNTIEAYLTNQRKGEIITKRVKELREAAKIEYLGKFAEKPAAAASSAASAAPAGASKP